MPERKSTSITSNNLMKYIKKQLKIGFMKQVSRAYIYFILHVQPLKNKYSFIQKNTASILLQSYQINVLLMK